MADRLHRPTRGGRPNQFNEYRISKQYSCIVMVSPMKTNPPTPSAVGMLEQTPDAFHKQFHPRQAPRTDFLAPIGFPSSQGGVWVSYN